MDPVIGGAIISSVAGIGGGIFGDIFGRGSSDIAWDRQKEALQNSIQWRVADAVKAGVHPLYALGAQPFSTQPVVVDDQVGPALERAGQRIGDMMSSRRLQHLQEEGARIENMSRAYDVSLKDEQLKTERFNKEKMLADQLSTISGVMPGPPTPYMRRYTLPGGLEMQLPAGDQGEAPTDIIQQMSYAHWLAVQAYNERVYGPEWVKKFNQFYYNYPGLIFKSPNK